MRPRSIAGRVALLAGGSIAVSGVVVAVVTGAIVVRMLNAQEDSRLHDAAATLALELSDRGVDPLWVAQDETRELAHTGMRVAVFEGRTFVAGDRTIGWVSAGACRDLDVQRGCGVAASHGTFVGVVARDRAARDDVPWLFAIAALIAVVATSIAGAIAARRLARWSIAPLVELRDAVEQIQPNAPERADLGPPRDVAEIDALRASLRGVLDRLGNALSHSRRFSSDAAHELRTPLTTILGELELAEEKADDADAQRSIVRAKETASRLALLVERLLVLATPAAALETVEQVDLRELVEDACATLPSAARARVRLEVSDGAVEGDGALITAMLTNAIENALKFSGSEVVVTVDERRSAYAITIDDDGPGIPEDERERVFQPFYRTRESRASGPPGYGIGLALIAHVAALHGGDARFVERPSGARLRIILPKSAPVFRGDARSTN